jgi:hypothetical protein
VDGGVREIQLSRGKVAIVDGADFEWLSQWKWRAHPNKRLDHHCPIKWYARCAANGYLHRFIMGAPQDFQVDHLNGDSLDNRRQNLRLCSHAQNMQNRRFPAGVAGFRGVRWDHERRRYRAVIEVNRKRVHLGHYRSAEVAARVLDLFSGIGGFQPRP